MARHGDWMQTYTGHAFWPLDPHPEDIHLADIAHSLAHICRYNGHCDRFYSVAEHCLLMAEAAITRFPGIDSLHIWQWALMHDAAEAYVADVPRPLKRFLNGYAEIERRVEAAIAARFKLPYPIPDAVKALDTAILLDEQAQLMKAPPMPWSIEAEPLGVTLKFWKPSVAKDKFLDMAFMLAVSR